jgi:dolichyl-phosphate-mannose--protein O-mannosyl transferase
VSTLVREQSSTATVEEGSIQPLWVLLGIGLVIRLLLIGSTGFHNDVSAFQSWTLTLRDNPPWAFYAKAGFADYPPGYFVVLWVLAKIYALLPGLGGEAANGWPVLRALVKLPAIAMDLVDAGVVFLIARRYASRTVALLAAALLALNPAAIYVSSYWGQVDSVSWGLVLIALWLVLRAGDEPARTVPRLVTAWLVMAFSILIKPQGATIALLLLAYPFATADAAVRARRLTGTLYGIGGSVALAVLVGLLFHPAADVFGWLLQRYAFGSAVYKYTSVNAFNLYALRLPFWQPDAQPISLFGFPLGSYAAWGVVLVAAATLLIVARYLQRRDDRALLEGAMLCALAFFVLATRMHERYVYGAFLLAMPLVAFGRTGLWSSLVLTVTMYLNLAYSLAYQTVMEAHTAGIDATDLWPAISHPAAFANVALFFWLGYSYLGGFGEAPAGAQSGARGEVQPTATSRALEALQSRARAWFDPREGVARMTRPDFALMGGLMLVAFVIAIVNIAWPPDKIFDEIYFARSAGEYLRHIPQYEWTHPPLTKEFIALSIAMFGDNSFGWRFLNVVMGAIEVGVLYAFAKRLTGSTLFAAVAGVLLTFDGFHFVEQRISVGEILIATLILTVLYALYRYWTSAQVRVEPRTRGQFGAPFWATIAAGVPVAAGFSWLANLQPRVHPQTEFIANQINNTTGPDLESYAAAFVYAMVGVYLIARLVVARRLPPAGRRISYADGTVIDDTGGKPAVRRHPEFATAEAGTTLGKDGSMAYATPVATARFSPAGTMRAGDTEVANAAHSRIWLGVLVVALGLLASCKWSAAFDFGVVFVIVALVAAQRFLTKPALYGNPFGFPLDVVAALAVFVPATIYTLSYLPNFLLGHGHSLADILALQHQMSWYHTHVVATHPYSSVWWQWPIMQIPISYYYRDFRSAAMQANGAACCVAEILALPNPAVFLLGLVSVPFTGWLAWKERNKGYALLFGAYVLQWLPWFHSPRLLFEYHFFPNLAVIVLCDVVLIQRVCAKLPLPRMRWALGGYLGLVVLLFAFFYPVLAGTQMTYDQWHLRMWPDLLGIPHTSWIIPHG